MPRISDVMGFTDIETFRRLAPDQYDALVDWKAGSISVLQHYKMDTIARGAHMQRQFTIQLRVDFADPGKLETLKETLLIAARHALATAQLISDNPKTTEIAIYSEDFFSGNQQIGLMEDILAKGLKDTAGGEPVAEQSTISDELLGAYK